MEKFLINILLIVVIISCVFYGLNQFNQFSNQISNYNINNYTNIEYKYDTVLNESNIINLKNDNILLRNKLSDAIIFILFLISVLIFIIYIFYNYKLRQYNES